MCHLATLSQILISKLTQTVGNRPILFPEYYVGCLPTKIQLSALIVFIILSGHKSIMQCGH